MISQLSVYGKNFNVVIFLDTLTMNNVKLCVMVVLTKLYPFIPLSVTLIIFPGHRSVKQFKLYILCSYLLKFKLCMLVDYIKGIMNISLFLTFSHIQRK